MRVYLYVPAEHHLMTKNLAKLPGTGEILAWNGREYSVTAVQAGRRPAILLLEARAALLPTAT